MFYLLDNSTQLSLFNYYNERLLVVMETDVTLSSRVPDDDDERGVGDAQECYHGNKERKCVYTTHLCVFKGSSAGSLAEFMSAVYLSNAQSCELKIIKLLCY